MPNNWKKYKFSDFVEINPTIRLSKDNLYSFVEMKDLNENNKYVLPSTEKKVTGGSRFGEKDTLFARITPCLQNGKICQVKGLKNKLGFGSTEFLVFRGKNSISDTDFVYYLSREEGVRRFAEQNMIGTSGRQRVVKDAFQNLVLDLPPLPEQQAIAEILSALDDKIELNLQTNKTLEEMANALYKHWFVDFGPFKNGKFFESELGMIPEGWEIKDLKDIAEIIMGQSPESKYYNEKNEGYPFHQGVSDYGLRFPTDRIFSTEGYRIAEKSDILFSVRAPVGKINIAKHKIILGRGLSAIRDKSGNNNFLFYSLKNKFKTIDSIGSGTVYNSVNKSDMEKIKILSPVIKEKTLFNNKVKDLDEQYLINDKENILLKQTRDYLLPKLISGQIRVKDVLKQKFLKDFASPNK